MWYAVSILIYPICATLVLVLGLALGAVSFPDASPDVGLFAQGCALAIASQFLTNILEESGFRGYLAPKMFTLGLNAFAAHVAVGLIWGVWHLPYLRAITPYTTESLATLVPRFLAGTVATSIVYGEIRLLTDSVWPAVLMQTVGGTFIAGLMQPGFIGIASGREFLVAPVLEGGLIIVLFTLIGVGVHLLRRKRAAAA